jgi:2-oxoglutarate dehydrogenase E2 component (dihydrolipoamide succinyltransferase)
MAGDIIVPSLGESVTEATIAKWLKQPGEAVAADDPVVELETDKVTLEIGAPAAGTLHEILAAEGATVPVGAVIGRVTDGAAGSSPHPPSPGGLVAPLPPPPNPPPRAGEGKVGASGEREGPRRIEDPPLDRRAHARAERGREDRSLERAGPAARKLIAENRVELAAISPTGRDGRISKADVVAALRREPPPTTQREPPPPAAGERETRVRMTRLRRRIAERLKAAQNTAAMLTTFNEIDMSGAIALRERHREGFEQRHGVRLGFMSIFLKAAIVALKEFPAVNAEIDGEDIVYKNHYDIGVAVGAEQGLVVPVVRDADRLSFAEIEKTIAGLGQKARDGKLTIADLSGGTFTISNGGVYGSLLSTPVLNPPQSGILGMHKIERRPVAVGDKVEIRPMMYVALSYDHRLIDGREAVGFLVRIKECVEDPSRILLEI